MPFDGVKFARKDQPDRPFLGGNLLAVVLVAFALLLMLTPVSITGFTDILNYLHHH